MNSFQKLGFIGLLINDLKSKDLDAVQNARLMDYVNAQGLQDRTQEGLARALHGEINVISRQITYFDASELKVNEVLNNYLKELSEIESGSYPPYRDISLMITSLGNKPGDNDHESGVASLIERANRTLDRYEDLDGDELPDQPDGVYRADARLLEFIDRVLSLVDIFVSARFGMVAGIEEYAPLPYEPIHPVDLFDTVTGSECGGDAECKCGCAVDRSLVQLQGIEDYIEGKTDTPDYYYFEGVSKANGLVIENISGNEGPVFDAVKNLGKVAYKAAMETWENVKQMFDEDDEKSDENITNVADDNKKAIQSMDSSATINDKAQAGIISMAKQVDPSGAMEKVVAKLEGPSSAPGVIDGLLGLIASKSLLTKELDDAKKNAQDTLDRLKKASDSVSGDDSNKEAAAAAKEAMKEKISQAKEAVGQAKKAALAHNKVVKGIRKAIRGISPHIFIIEVKKKEGDDK